MGRGCDGQKNRLRLSDPVLDHSNLRADEHPARIEARTERASAGSWPRHLRDVTPSRPPADSVIRMSLLFWNSVEIPKAFVVPRKSPRERGSP
jgi:hypothetical protein